MPKRLSNDIRSTIMKRYLAGETRDSIAKKLVSEGTISNPSLISVAKRGMTAAQCSS